MHSVTRLGASFEGNARKENEVEEGADNCDLSKFSSSGMGAANSRFLGLLTELSEPEETLFDIPEEWDV